jgi:ABC-type nitrate/sulfonate/bicarbonate transport system permease component
VRSKRPLCGAGRLACPTQVIGTMNFLAQTTTYDNSGAAAAAVAAMMGGILIGALIAIVISVAIYYVILNRAGFNPWLSLLVLIPGLGHLIIVIILVFTEWPVQQELKLLRAQVGGGSTPSGSAGGYPPPGGPPMTTA